MVKRLETRVIVCTDSGGKYGVTYRWNAAGTDATLLDGGESENFQMTKQDGSTEARTWSYPSRADCMQCHTPASGQAIGIRTHQLNLTVPHPTTGSPVNQLSYFESQGYFRTGTHPSPDFLLRSRAIDDVAVPAEHRVRSYLDSNCAHCHQPGGSVPYFDARLQTPLKNQNLVNAIIQGQFNLPGGCYITPGSPALSAVHVRTASAQPGIAMPPIGKHVVDQQAVALISQYITGLTPAEFAVTAAPQARYVRFTATAPSGNLLTVGELVVLDGNGAAIPRASMTVSAFTSESSAGNSANVIDGNPWTFWSTTAVTPATKTLTLDLGSVKNVGGMEYVPRQDSATGRPTSYQVHYSVDGTSWSTMTNKTVGNSPPATTERFDGFVGRRKIRTSIAAAPTSLAKRFPVTIVFDSAVTGFSASHVTVTGGTVESLRGIGHYYVAMISASQANVTVSVPANQVNPGTFGNQASNTVTVTSSLQTPPAATLTSTMASYHRAIEVKLSIDQSHTGLTAEDFIVTNATLEWLLEDGNDRRLVLVPTGTGLITVELREGSFTGTNGLPVGSTASFSAPYGLPVLEMEAEDFPSRGAFQIVADPAASGGNHVWVAEGSRSSTAAELTFSLTRSIHLPVSGDYRVRGWTRADDLASDSFHVRLGASFSVAQPWRTNQEAGETGSGLFHPGFARADGGIPHLFPITAGNSVLQIHAAEDGTRLDRVALIPPRPYPQWGGAAASFNRPIAATLRFVSPVTGLTQDDFEVLGGTVTGLTGSGQDYTVMLQPTAGKIAARLKENAVTDEFGAAGVESSWFFTRWNNTYDQWINDNGLDSSPTADLLDTDGDGVPQILEYALGLDPKKADGRVVNPADPASRGLPAMGIDTTGGNRRLSMTFHRRRGGLALDYTAEFTGDFLDYSRTTDFTGKTQVIDDEWERVTATDDDATGNEQKRFGRLKVER